MRVITADALGMCFGVRDALTAMRGLADPASVTIYGELVHNEEVIGDLRKRGFASVDEEERGRIPATPQVLITAHGVSDRERARLLAAGRRLIDTTCPLVRRAHETALRLAGKGCFVVVIGMPGHVEVRGLTGDLDDVVVVPGPEAVRTWPRRRIGVLCQTTVVESTARETLAAIRRANPTAEVLYEETICRPTRDRQTAVEALLQQVDAVVVVGGRNSNNTRMLAERAREHGLPAYHVQGPDDLDPARFADVQTVGITAGTSTLPATVLAVRQALEQMHAFVL